MRTIRPVLCALAVTAAVLVLAPIPAFAGGWATTLLDPLPDGIRSGPSYTVGFWILQHGSHVSQIHLNDPGLKLVDDGQQAVTFKGVPMAEGGHFATAIVLPHDGRWIVFGMQSPFQDYQVGVLTVPGGVIVAPTPEPMPAAPDESWSTVKPPQVVGAPYDASGGAARLQRATPQKSPAKPFSIPPVPEAGLGAAVLLVLAAAGIALRIRRLSRRSGGDGLAEAERAPVDQVG